MVSTPDAENRIYELAGDSAFTRADLAAEVSRQSGKAIAYSDLPEAEYARPWRASACRLRLRRSWPSPKSARPRAACSTTAASCSALIGRPTTRWRPPSPRRLAG
ncbi:hypothetical protein ACRAWD_12880 [Caulobacter segnis]